MSVKPHVFNANHIVSDIVIRFPKASDYFRDHKIDFCCGGKRPLRYAVQERGLDIDQVLEELHHLVANHAGLSEGINGINHFMEMDSPSLMSELES